MKKKILVVDDQEGFTSVLRLNLESTNQYETRVVNVSKETVRIAEEFKPDLILLDVVMPELKGSEIAKSLKYHPQLKDVPIVFFTATVTPETLTKQEGLLEGYDYIAKPGKLEEILEVIERNLHQG